ncbi:MAG: hypothetical protein JRH18_04930 [Deltaproteobacteria bacterium]|nr:hypothetical protein [Deltaproteobacteria bacterium]MBW1962881.1 hypothetical protein [Deltaproteobacteria bacterium]MBW2150989.1 hypothetical protein [Deltaproteobacteria bacterium]
MGTTKKVSVIILPEKKYPFKIVDAVAERGKFIRFEMETVKRENRDAYLLIVENTKTTKGRFFDTIKLKIDSKIRSNIDIWVFGNIN